MRIEDVSERMVFNSVLDGYGLQARFIRQPRPTCQISGVNIYGGSRMDVVVSLSVSEYKKIGFDDLPELCEYWKMLAVFR
jgi:hypothetical protein